ncbi:MAG TPA: heme exporter protein CcmD [Xanthobacteraceae bacterium]|jgi:heme exporter protein D|nr:heme exporter protein CcmD [Xanthobacteraceae bacterium]
MTFLGIDLGNHAGFIIASYAVAAVIVGGLIAWVMADYRTQRRKLVDLDRRGLRRRSASARSEGQS